MAGTWGVEGTTATYKNEAGKVVAKITGLSSGVTATKVEHYIWVTEGEGGAAGTITLGSAVLGTDTKTPVKLTLNNGGKYVLALDEDTVDGVSVTDIALDYSVDKKKSRQGDCQGHADGRLHPFKRREVRNLLGGGNKSSFGYGLES